MASSINSKTAATGVICPAYLPPYSTVFWHYKQWRSDGVLELILVALHGQVRQQVKKPKWTRLLIIDSQAVKNTCNASVEFHWVLSLQVYQWERVLGQIICPKISHYQAASCH